MKTSAKKTASSIPKAAERLIEKVQKIKDAVEETTVETSVGGDMITVVTDCKQQVLIVRIDPEIFKPEDHELVEELLARAVTLALQKAELLLREEMFRRTKHLMPEIEKANKNIAGY